MREFTNLSAYIVETNIDIKRHKSLQQIRSSKIEIRFIIFCY